MTGTDLLQLRPHLGLTPIPLKPRSKDPLVKWGNSWNPSLEVLQVWASQGVKLGCPLSRKPGCPGLRLAGGLQRLPLPADHPIVKTRRGFHIWFKPKKLIRS